MSFSNWASALTAAPGPLFASSATVASSVGGAGSVVVVAVAVDVVVVGVVTTSSDKATPLSTSTPVAAKSRLRVAGIRVIISPMCPQLDFHQDCNSNFVSENTNLHIQTVAETTIGCRLTVTFGTDKSLPKSRQRCTATVDNMGQIAQKQRSPRVEQCTPHRAHCNLIEPYFLRTFCRNSNVASCWAFWLLFFANPWPSSFAIMNQTSCPFDRIAFSICSASV